MTEQRTSDPTQQSNENRDVSDMHTAYAATPKSGASEQLRTSDQYNIAAGDTSSVGDLPESGRDRGNNPDVINRAAVYNPKVIEQPPSNELLDLLRYRILDRRNNDENAMLRLMSEAADEIERLRAALKTVGDDYPGSSCQIWCYQQAGLVLPDVATAGLEDRQVEMTDTEKAVLYDRMRELYRK